MNLENGMRKEQKLKGYSEEIHSENLLSFSYENGDFSFRCERDDSLHIYSSGGSSHTRDGSYFRLDYQMNSFDFLKDLQGVIQKYHLSRDNGYFLEVEGLPPECGDTISVLYDNQEKIYKHSNQEQLVPPEAQEEIYDLFHNLALRHGYDFTSAKSNVSLYDDATEEMLAGTWRGTHFGDEILVSIDSSHIQIYVNQELTDDSGYVIVNGFIRSNQFVEGIDTPKNEYDYEAFVGVPYFKKKTDKILVAYFVQDSYSTAELFKEKGGQ